MPKVNLIGILLYYSTLLTTILIAGGFYMASTTKQYISNSLFLPVVALLWILLIQRIKQKRAQKKNK